LKVPFFNQFGGDSDSFYSFQQEMFLTNLKGEKTVHWYNPGQLLYYAFLKGITQINPENGLQYYIDPFSMLLSTLPESMQSKILPGYYEVYQTIIPTVFGVLKKFWAQFSVIASYTIITRLGKRYCPYLIRWHWTFLLILKLVEPIVIYLMNRVYYFQTVVLIPRIKTDANYGDFSLSFQIDLLNVLMSVIVVTHIGLILFGLFHAICGQYFYFPFFVENTELHVGSRPANSIYSGGYTSWQDPKEKTANRVFPKLWYGWFGRGGSKEESQRNSFVQFFKKLLKRIRKFFQR
jgi:hypothetical protein